MKETFTEFEELQEALKKVNMAEDTMPFVRGRLCESKSYNKMQQILAAPEMIKSHAYILNLDPEQLEEDEIERIDKLWNLGVNRGFIVPDEECDCDSGECTDDSCKNVASKDAFCEPRSTSAIATLSSQKVKVPCWTVLYSACDKNGDIKTGECYSNAINTRAAKADCYAKLERCGYTNISILAIEAGDPDSCGCEDFSTLEQKAKIQAEIQTAEATKAQADKEVAELTAEEEEVKENDLLKNKPHNAHISEGDVEEADHSFDEPGYAHVSTTQKKVTYTKDGKEEVEVAGPTDDEKAASDGNYEKLYAEFLTAADDYQQVLEFNDEDSIEVKNAFKEVQGAYEDCYAAVSKEDEKELLSQVAAYGFKLTPDNCRIVEEEIDESLDESGNPYAAGMKTSSIGGVSDIKQKNSTPKKKENISEDDEDASDDASDDADDIDSDEENKEDTEEDASTEENDADSNADKDDTDETADSSDDEKTSDEDEDEETEDTSDENADDTEKSDDEDADDASEDKDESKEETSDKDAESDEETEDADDDEDADEDSDEDEDEDDANDDDDDDDDDEVKKKTKEDLSDEEKTQYKNEYKRTFKDVMSKCKFEDLCFDDLSIAQKVKFFKKLNKAWTKNEPQDFMSDKEIEQLNKVVIKK